MKNYTNSTPVFSESIQITETTDPAHADNVNAAPKQLLQNTLANRAAIERLEAQSGSVGEYNPETVYAAGDYCVYGNVTHKCIRNGATGEWDLSCWEVMTVVDAVKKLESPEFDDYSMEGTQIPDARTAIENIRSKTGLAGILSNVKAALTGLARHQDQHYITLPADGWGTEAPYVQTAELTGASAADVPVIGLSLTGSTATDRKAEKKAWSCVDKAEAGDGVITFTCYDKKPGMNITLVVKGVG